MAIVMCVAAVDTYMHSVVLRSVGAMDTTKPTPALRNLDISFGELVDLSDSVARARREGRNTRPRVQVKNALHRRLLRMTYQGPEQVAAALRAAGVEDGWNRAAAHLGQPTKTLKKRLGRMVERRNQIVHEGDLRRRTRPQGLSLNAINPTSVKRDVEWTEKLLDAFDSLF